MLLFGVADCHRNDETAVGGLGWEWRVRIAPKLNRSKTNTLFFLTTVAIVNQNDFISFNVEQFLEPLA